MKPLVLTLILLSLVSLVSAQAGNDRTIAPAQNDSSLTSQTFSSLRHFKTPDPIQKIRYVTEPDKEGFFIYDPADKNTADDSVMTIVTASGMRFKRKDENGILNAKWFGAKGNGIADDWYSIQKAINYILANSAAGRTLYFPSGTYLISRPLIIARLVGNTYKQVSINLVGPANSKTIPSGYTASITPIFNNTFAIGIQMGKGVLIKDLMITGKFTFPNTLTEIQVDTLSFKEWTDGSSRDNRLSPYSGIVIDPFSDSAVYETKTDMYPGLHSYYCPGLGHAGSTSVQVVGCSIRNFVVGVMITPSNQQNGDLIDVIDCEISGAKVAYCMGQAQSKECHVLRLKCWQPTHTVFDNGHYGFRHGDGSAIPMVDGVNIASYVKQLCAIYAASFNGSFRNVYAEGLFRLGFVGGPATVSFEDCQIDFSTQNPGIPYPDFYVLGSGASFQNCLLRFYPGVPGARLILSGTNNHYEGGTMNAPPVTVNLDNNGLYPTPSFHNVGMYYSGGILGSSNRGAVTAASPFKGSNGNGTDPVYFGNSYSFQNPFYGADLFYKMNYKDGYERTARLSGTPVLHTNKSTWTAYFKLIHPADTNVLKTGDFILTTGLHYLDGLENIAASTYPVGIIHSINHDTVNLVNLALGINNGTALSLWTDYFINEQDLMTGDLPDKSNTLVNVQGRFPAVGERLDIPMLPTGTFVTAVNTTAKTIRFSNPNMTGQSYTDYTFINGYPNVEMYSSFDLPFLQGNGKTLIGGADFYKYDATEINTHDKDFPVKGTLFDHYKNLNTNIRGDTSLHKFKYTLLSAKNAGISLPIGTTSQRPSYNPTTNFRINKDSLSNGIYHAEIFDGKAYRQLAYMADLDNLSSTHSTGKEDTPVVLSAAGGLTVKITGNDVNMQVSITAPAPVNGNLVRISFASSWKGTPIAVLSNGNALSASNAANLFCNAASPAELFINGNLLSKGVYVFNIHVGQ